MAAVLIAILSLTVLGIPIALALDRGARGPLLIGTAFLYGSGAVFLILLFVPWKLPLIVGVALMLAVGCWLLAVQKRLRPTANGQRPTIVDLATLISLAAYAIYATLAPLWEWDFWAIWGLKARVFFEHGGIDWRFLESRWNAFAHPDYPLLVPLNFDFVALIGGGWSDRWLGILFIAYAVALLLIARALAARETSALFAALLTFLLSWIATSRFIGLAEGALIAFGGAAVLFIRDALRRDDAASWRHGAVLLGLAANCKNEGLALLVAVTIAILLLAWRTAAVSAAGRAASRRPEGETPSAQPARTPAFRMLFRLWPSYALAAPWLILRAMHTLGSDIVGSHAAARLVARLRFTPQILGYLATKLYHPWFWVAILVGVILMPRVRERFVLLVTAIQVVFYISSYFATPYDVRWHIGTSWPRLTEQIAVPIAFVVFLALAEIVRRGEDARDAEARSEQQ